VAYEAGKRRAQLITAEVAEDHPVFMAFRGAGFAVFSRQVILRRAPGLIPEGDTKLLRPELEQDCIGIRTLHVNTVPRLLQQAEVVPVPEGGGLVYERNGQIAGYLGVIEGKNGIVIKPYFHPEIYDQAPAIVMSALLHIPRADRLPVYLYARAYQDWLRGALEHMEFIPWTHQALLVKHTMVRVERLEPVPVSGLDASHLRPPVADGPLPLHKLFNREGRWPFRRRNGK
jgi:hypothetical protein